MNRGSVSEGEDALVPSWRECSDDLKECLGSVVIPLCSLSVGLCRHRALLFKVRISFNANQLYIRKHFIDCTCVLLMLSLLLMVHVTSGVLVDCIF